MNVLYEKYVNYSVFHGHITLEVDAKKHLLSTVFHNSTHGERKNIQLIINNTYYNASLLHVPSSSSVQIHYNNNVKSIFKDIFPYSYHQCVTLRKKPQRPKQTVETIRICETTSPFVYRVETFSINQNDIKDALLVNEINMDFPSPTANSISAWGTKRPKANPIKTNGQDVYPRNKNIALKALDSANYSCEINATHPTFIRRNSDKNYTEPHHLIPLAFSGNFSYSLDIEENIISLCSNCHNEIHYGKNAAQLIRQLFSARKDALKQAGIDITIDELLKMYHL